MACSTAAKFGTDVSWAERITEVENDGTQSLLPDTADRWFAAGFLEEDIATGPLVLTDLATVDDAAYIACCRALALYDLEGRLGGITTPTLFMAGTQDPGCTPEAMGQLRDAVEGSELAVIPDSAHLPWPSTPSSSPTASTPSSPGSDGTTERTTAQIVSEPQ